MISMSFLVLSDILVITTYIILFKIYSILNNKSFQCNVAVVVD